MSDNEILNIYNKSVEKCSQNYDDLYTDDFLFVIPDLGISQKIQTVLPPEIIADPILTPYYNRIVKTVADRITFSKLIIDMKVNKNLYNLKVITDWFKLYGTYNDNLSGADTVEQYKHLYKDLYLFIINPVDGQTPLAYIKYKNSFPTAISNPSFDPSASNVIRISVNFEVEDFEIVII